MPTITIDGHTIRSIVKWELMRAHSSLFAKVIGKGRPDREAALNALADLIAKRLEVYTITREGLGKDGSALAARPDYSEWGKEG